MKRKLHRPLVLVNKKVHVVHLNVGSGYVTYLEEDVDEDHIKVKGISLDGRVQRKTAKG